MKIKIRNKFIVNDIVHVLVALRQFFFDDRIVKRIIKTIEFKMQEMKSSNEISYNILTFAKYQITFDNLYNIQHIITTL